MNTLLNDVLTAKWDQLLLEFDNAVSPNHKERIPVAGIMYYRPLSSIGVIVSALPEHGATVDSLRWNALKIPTTIVPYDGVSLSSLGFPKLSYETFRISSFVKQVNLDAVKPTIAPHLFASTDNASGDIIVDRHRITGIRYRLENNNPSVEWINWSDGELQPISSSGKYTAYSVKGGKDTFTSFWGAPILTAGGEIKSIVVYQQNIDDETVAIVGMQIKSFINAIPLLSI